MKKIMFSVLATFLSIALPMQADFGYTCDLFEKIKDASDKYGKRGRALDAIISNALSTNNNIWIRTDNSSFDGETERWTSYSPEHSDSKLPARSFTLSELNLKKYKNHKILNLINAEKEKLKDFDSVSHISRDKNGSLIKHTFEYKVNPLFEYENNICFETVLYGVTQKCLRTGETLDLLGNTKEGVLILQGEPKIDDTPKKYTIFWVVYLGNDKYRQYSYGMREKIATKEEKDFLLDLFKKMEEQIKKVPA